MHYDWSSNLKADWDSESGTGLPWQAEVSSAVTLQPDTHDSNRLVADSEVQVLTTEQCPGHGRLEERVLWLYVHFARTNVKKGLFT